MPKCSIGVELGGTNLRIAAVNQQGDLMEKVTLGTRVALGKDHVIHQMCDAIRLLAAKYRDSAALQGIGIGVPGIIDMKTGMLRESPSLPGWAESPVPAQMGGRLGTAVVLETGATVAERGGEWAGGGRAVEGMGWVTPAAAWQWCNGWRGARDYATAISLPARGPCSISTAMNPASISGPSSRNI